jgi:gamma-glutamyltranspeptidase
LLREKANAMDAGLATAICIGALHQHSSGIGGGFLATYYEKYNIFMHSFPTNYF